MELLWLKCDVYTIYHIPQFCRCVTTSPGVLQLSLKCATTFHQNAYNYITTSMVCCKNTTEDTSTQVPKPPVLLKHKI